MASDLGWLAEWLFGLNGPLRQYFSLNRTVSQRKDERVMIDESKDVQTTPTRTYCKRSRLLPFCSDIPALKVYPAPAHHPSDVDLHCLPMTLLRVSR